VKVIGTLIRSIPFHCPSVWGAELDKAGIIIFLIHSSGFEHFRWELLEGTTVGTGPLTLDLDLITTEEWGDPVSRTSNWRYSSLDADIGTGMVDRKGPGCNSLRVVPREVSPLQGILAVGQPVGKSQIVARADLGIAGIGARTIAVARVALALDNIITGEKGCLPITTYTGVHSSDDSHLDESSIVVVPPPLERNGLPSLEVIGIRDNGAGVLASVVVAGDKGTVDVLPRNGREHVRVRHRR